MRIIELMHGKKKRLSYMVSNFINRILTLPLARVHPGFVLCLCSKVATSKLTMQILMRAKLHLSFFLCSLYALKTNYKGVQLKKDYFHSCLQDRLQYAQEFAKDYTIYLQSVEFTKKTEREFYKNNRILFMLNKILNLPTNTLKLIKVLRGLLALLERVMNQVIQNHKINLTH